MLCTQFLCLPNAVPSFFYEMNKRIAQSMNQETIQVANGLCVLIHNFLFKFLVAHSVRGLLRSKIVALHGFLFVQLVNLAPITHSWSTVLKIVLLKILAILE